MIAFNELLDWDWSVLDCIIFSALISSTDTVSVQSVFHSFPQANKDVLSIVLGESTLNDGVSVSLYGGARWVYLNKNNSHKSEHLTVYFFSVCVGSVLIGFFSSLLTSLFWKKYSKTYLKNPILETLLYLLMGKKKKGRRRILMKEGIAPYYLSDSLHLSGIVTAVSSSILLSIYGHPLLSKTSSFHLNFLVECLGRLFESLIFGYLGKERKKERRD